MEALHARSDRGVLTLTLDTPGSDVNVFDLRAANALADALETLDPAIEAVVLASAKPGSFVNGVGLMMAGAVKAPGDVAQLTAPVRRAYRALRNARVPTIATIAGNCFGCGVELALQCTHRIAVEDGPTCFYMTEIADYLFVPCFGATQDLPAIVGLDAAVRLLVFGERWTARDALRGGLVDRAVPVRGSDEAFAAFVDEVRGGRVPSRRAMRAVGQVDLAPVRERLADLPEAMRFPSEAALALLERGARGEAAYDDEIQAAGETVVRDASKAAQGFFFVRQIAAQRERRSQGPRTRALVLAGLPRLLRQLRQRAPADLAIVDAPAPRPEAHRLLLASSSGPGVDVVVSTASAPPVREGGRAVAWAPLLGLGHAFVEIDAVRAPAVASQLASALHRAGFETAQTRPSGAFVTERVAGALLDPIARFVARTGRAADAARTARALGFARPPATLALALGHARGASGEADASSGEASPALAAAIAATLVALTFELLRGGEIPHPATLDVLARHVLDFPLAERSLCSFASVRRAASLLDRANELEPFVDPSVLARLEDHARGRDHYR